MQREHLDEASFIEQMRDELDFRTRVYWLTSQIPPGRVATYGQLAFLGGRTGAARAVGTFLKQCHEHGQHDLPWHRVINAQGGISYRGNLPRAQKQLALLEAEGIIFHKSFQCDLDIFEWEPAFGYWAQLHHTGNP